MRGCSPTLQCWHAVTSLLSHWIDGDVSSKSWGPSSSSVLCPSSLTSVVAGLEQDEEQLKICWSTALPFVAAWAKQHTEVVNFFFKFCGREKWWLQLKYFLTQHTVNSIESQAL